MSAIADGEPSPVDVRLVDAHLGRCEACRAYQGSLRPVPAGPRPVSQPEMPDLAGQVTRRAQRMDRARVSSVPRILLGVTAVVLFVLALPDLAIGKEPHGASHDAHHVGAFTMAYAIGLLVIVARPARARTMLPIALVLSGTLVITGTLDLIEGELPFTQELAHLPELLSVLLIWLLAAPSHRRVERSRRRPAESSPLQTVSRRESA